MLEIYYFCYIICNIIFTISMYFYLSFYNRLIFIFMIIFKNNTNTVIYLMNHLHHYILYTDNVLLKNFEMPCVYFLNLLHVLKNCFYLMERMCDILLYYANHIYQFLHKNKTISLHIERIEKDIEEYNIIYLKKRDQLIQSLLKNIMSNIIEITNSNKKNNSKTKNTNKYKKNINSTFNKLKNKKIS